MKEVTNKPTTENLKETIIAMLDRLDAEQLQKVYIHTKIVERT